MLVEHQNAKKETVHVVFLFTECGVRKCSVSLCQSRKWKRVVSDKDTLKIFSGVTLRSTLSQNHQLTGLCYVRPLCTHIYVVRDQKASQVRCFNPNINKIKWINVAQRRWSDRFKNNIQNSNDHSPTANIGWLRSICWWTYGHKTMAREKGVYFKCW